MLCPVPSARGLQWASPPPKQIFKPPQIETWKTINQWSFCQFLECQDHPRTNAKAPYWKLSGDGSGFAKDQFEPNRECLSPVWITVYWDFVRGRERRGKHSAFLTLNLGLFLILLPTISARLSSYFRIFAAGRKTSWSPSSNFSGSWTARTLPGKLWTPWRRASLNSYPKCTARYGEINRSLRFAGVFL